MVQLEILGLLRDLCGRLHMGILFITHDLGVVSQLADRVVVMYAGQIVETGDVRALFSAPIHPYTAGLIACVPDPASGRESLVTIPGQAPRPDEVTSGCPFEPRCERAGSVCREGAVPLVGSGDRTALCHFPLTEKALHA